MSTENLLAILNLLVGIVVMGGLPWAYVISNRLTRIETLLSLRDEEAKRMATIEAQLQTLREKVIVIEQACM
jgi:hypothetical protein